MVQENSLQVQIKFVKFCITSYRICIITTCKRSLGQGNIFSSMCQEFCSQGGVPGQVPPWAGTPSPRQVHPWAGTPPPDRYPPGMYTLPLGRNTPLGRYTPTGTVHAGRYGQQAGGTHPTGMHSCFNSI